MADNLHLELKEVDYRSIQHLSIVVEEVDAVAIKEAVAELDSWSTVHDHLQTRSSWRQEVEAQPETADCNHLLIYSHLKAQEASCDLASLVLQYWSLLLQ